MNNSGSIHKILIIKPGAIGDLLQLTPVVRVLKNKYPDADISILVGSKSTAELFKYNANVRETIVFDKKGEHRTILSLMNFRRLLKGRNYDLVVNFQRSNLKTWFLASAAFPCRLLVYHKSGNNNVHAVLNHLETIAPLGVTMTDLTLDLTTGPDEQAFADQVISRLGKNKGPIVALNPGASHEVNRWSTNRFAALADMLVEKISGKILIIGGPDDVPLAEEIADKARSKSCILAGKSNLLELAAVLKQCDVLVTGDTGPMHIASAVGTKIVALFGAADPARTGPLGLGHRILQADGVSCVPCRSRKCGNKIYRECMEKISANTVFKTIVEIVKGSPSPAGLFP